MVDKQSLYNVLVKEIAGNDAGGNFSVVKLNCAGMIRKKQCYMQLLPLIIT